MVPGDFSGFQEHYRGVKIQGVFQESSRCSEGSRGYQVHFRRYQKVSEYFQMRSRWHEEMCFPGFSGVSSSVMKGFSGGPRGFMRCPGRSRGSRKFQEDSKVFGVFLGVPKPLKPPEML